MRHVIEVLADKNTVFETKPSWGKSVITALGRLNGQTVGFLGNNPMYKGGAADPDGCAKKLQAFLFIAIVLIFP